MNIQKLLPLLFCSMLSLSLSLQPTDAGAGSSADGSASVSIFELARGDKYPEAARESQEGKVISAILNDNTTTFNDLLPSIENLNFTWGEWTPLMYACRHGRLEMVRTLLARGVNISCYSTNMSTALSLAAANGDYKRNAKIYAISKTSHLPKVGFDNGSIALPFVATLTNDREISNRIKIINLLLARPDLKVHSDHESSEKIKVFLKGIVGDKALSLEDRLRMIKLFLSYKVLPVADLLFPERGLKQLEVDNEAKKYLKVSFSFDIETKREDVAAVRAQEKDVGESDEKYEGRINRELRGTLDLSDKEYDVFWALRRYSFIRWQSPLRKALVQAVAVPSAALHKIGGAGAGSSVGDCGAGSSAGVFELAKGDGYPVIKEGSEERRFIDAIRNRDMDRFNNLLPCTKNLDSTYGALTPLMYACTKGEMKMIQALLARPDVNISCYGTHLQTALSFAAYYNSDAKNNIGTNTRIEIVNLLLARPDLKVHSDHESSETIKEFLKGIVGDKALSLEDRLPMINLFLSRCVFVVADLLFPGQGLKQLEVDNEAKKYLKRIFRFDIDDNRTKVTAILAQEKGASESDEEYIERINTQLKDVLGLSGEEYTIFQKLREYVCWSLLRREWVQAVAVPSAALHKAGGTGSSASDGGAIAASK